MDGAGKLLAHVQLGEGALLSSGGIEYDGAHIWVPVAEYRPDSRAIVYRVDPDTLKATEHLPHLGQYAPLPRRST